MTYALSIHGGNGTASGFIDSQTGLADVLVKNGNTIEGHVGNANGALTFTISINPNTGVVTFTEDRAVFETQSSTNPSANIATMSANVLTLTATITDGLGHRASASLDLGKQISLTDDGPSIVADAAAVAPGALSESNLADGTQPNSSLTSVTGHFAGDFTDTSGADGLKSTTYALSIAGGDGTALGLRRFADGQADVLVQNGNTIEGHVGAANGALAFTITLDPTTGDITFTEDRAIQNNNTGSTGLSLAAGVVTLTETITDNDGSVASVNIDLGTKLAITDDGPILVSQAMTSGSVNEGGLGANDTWGVGNSPGAVVVATGTVKGDVNFGADGPATGGGFSFVAASSAVSALTGLGLTSHGFAVDQVSISGDTLTAKDSNGDSVFTLQLTSSGTWTFTLLEPLDHPAGNGENVLSFDLSGLVQATDADGTVITLSGDFSVSVKDDVPVLTGLSVTGTVFEAGLTSGTDSYGSGTQAGHQADPVSKTGLLASLVSFGADGPDGKGGASITGGDTGAFQFVSQAKADTWLQGLDLTSHGLSVDAATISISNGIETLTASTTGLGAHEVFTLSLNEATGAWTFTLINPIDQQAGHGANSQTIDLSGLVQAVDFDGDTVTLSGDFSVSVKDDVPVLTGLSVTGTVFEAGLTSGTDSYGSGTQAGHQADPVSKTGSLASLVSFGADGPDGKGGASITGGDTGAFQFVSQAKADTWLQGLDLTSHGLSVDAATISISNGIETLTASTTGLGAHEVFTLSLNEATGDWTFTLINPIDQQAGHGANSQTIDLSGLVQAVDFDGDTVTLSGDFSVSVKDDVPVLTGLSVTGTVFEAGLTSGTDSYGSGTQAGHQADPVSKTGLLASLVSFWRRRSGRQGWCVDHWRRHGRVPVCIVIGGVVVADAS